MERLSERLRAARQTQGLTLDAVAKLSGVSRSMVSQIERGESSPTIATLWNLTQALRIDFAGLLDGGDGPGIAVTRAGDVPTIGGRGTGVRIRILSPPEEAGRHEVYDIAFTPGGMLDSAPHAGGSREILTVLEGRVAVRSGTDTADLGPGDVARYPVDRPHAITAGEGGARVLLIVTGG
jgi:transcriptional regulator with XRE-family HTH domain